MGGVAVAALHTSEIQSVTGYCGCLYPYICVVRTCVCVWPQTCRRPIRGRAAFCTLSHTIPSGAWLCETALSQASRPCSLAFPKCGPAGGRLSRPPEWHTHTLLAGEGGTVEKEGSWWSSAPRSPSPVPLRLLATAATHLMCISCHSGLAPFRMRTSAWGA